MVAGLIVAAVAASWLADKLRVPSVVILLAVGVTVGPVLGVLDPAELFGDLFSPVVSVAVGIILFEGGLSLRLREIKGSQPVVWLLVTVGVLVTWVVGALAAWAFTDLGLAMAILLGSILVVSGPTVVGPVLRIVRPNRRIGSILKWESIFIDPLGAMLAVITFDIIVTGQGAPGAGEVVREVLLFVAVGLASAGVLAAAAVFVLRRHWVPGHLVPLFGLGAALAAYLVAETFVPEAGLLATTAVGLILSNHPRVSTEEMTRFSEDLRVLLIGVLFIVLSARLSREQVFSLGWGAAGVVAALVLVARPVGVWLSTWGSDLRARERLLLAGVAPRGIVAASVASVFGLELEEAGVPGAALITPLAFAAIIATVLVYGLGAGPLARRLGLASGRQDGVLVVGAGPVERAIACALHDAGVDVVVATVNRSDEWQARQQGLQTFYGNVLDEHIDLRLEMSGMGKLLALTRNDEVNTLATRRFTDMLGHGEVFQLSPATPPPGVEGGAADLGGRLLFARDLDYDSLEERLRDGSIHATPVTEDADVPGRDDDGEAVPLFALRDGRLLVEAVDAPAELADRVQPGDRLFWLGA